VQNVIGRALIDQDFQGALLSVAAAHGSGGTVCNRRLAGG